MMMDSRFEVNAEGRENTLGRRGNDGIVGFVMELNSYA